VDLDIAPRARAGMTLQVGIPERGPESITAALQVGEREHRVRIEAAGELSPHAEPFVAASLFPAMRLGLPVHSEAPITPEAAHRLPRLSRIAHTWWRDVLQEAAIRAPVREPAARAPGTASFFSGGVDSLHTALTHRRELDGLVCLEGFDLPLGEPARLQAAVEGARRAADALGLPLVVVRTDLRYFTEAYVHWDYAHGSVLAAVAYALAPRFGRFLVPSSSSFFEWYFWGSHAILDPIWSTEEVGLEYDAYLVRRSEKIRALIDHPEVLGQLRVCHQRGASGYNCGRCEKCVRTMVTLAAVGALDHGPPFERPFDLAAVRDLQISPFVRGYWEDLHRAAVQWGAPGPLIDAVARVRERRRRQNRAARRTTRRLRRSAGLAYRRLRGRPIPNPWRPGP
jgi:hypothetical protein